MDNIKQYYLDSEPVIKIGKLDIIAVKKNKKKKNINKLSLDDFSEGMMVEFMIKNSKKTGMIVKINPELKTKVIVKVGTKEIKVPISKLNIVKSTDKKELDVKEDLEKELVLDDFKEGMIVSVDIKDKSYDGDVVGINKEKGKVQVKIKNKIILVPVKKLKVKKYLSDEEEPVKEEPVKEEPVKEEPVEEEEPDKDDDDKEDKEDKQVPEIGSEVKWTNSSGKVLTGIIEDITKNKLKYKICCKPGKQSGEKGSVYMIDKNIVSLV